MRRLVARSETEKIFAGTVLFLGARLQRSDDARRIIAYFADEQPGESARGLMVDSRTSSGACSVLPASLTFDPEEPLK
jgi:hypothetical protein